nr:hypothetical protein BaRGS_005294 [Batillaria attramentaria]
MNTDGRAFVIMTSESRPPRHGASGSKKQAGKTRTWRQKDEDGDVSLNTAKSGEKTCRWRTRKKTEDLQGKKRTGWRRSVGLSV